MFLDRLQIGRPHVRADELDPGGEFHADHGEERTEALGGALLTDPQQPSTGAVDLVDEREVLMTLAVLAFINPDSALFGDDDPGRRR